MLVVPRDSGLDEAMKKVMSRGTLNSLPGKAPVPGKWSQSGSVLSFSPSEPLVDSEYIFSIGDEDPELEVIPRTAWYFRVGSLIRVRAIEVLPDKERGTGYVVQPVLSESFDSAKLSMSLQVQATESTWSDVSLTKTEGAFKVPLTDSTFSLDKRIRVDVAYPNLDGKLIGSPDSGNFVAEFIPAELTQSGQVTFLPDMPEPGE